MEYPNFVHDKSNQHKLKNCSVILQLFSFFIDLVVAFYPVQQLEAHSENVLHLKKSSLTPCLMHHNIQMV